MNLFTKKVRHAGSYQIIDKPLRILNYAEFLSAKKPKHALLSYLTQPVLNKINGEPTSKFSNDGLALSWPKVLNQLGYEVDIINWDDTTFKFPKDYDLVVSHGAINFTELNAQLAASTPYIYFSTGNYWKFHIEQEVKRAADLKKRHGVSLPPDRHIDFPEEAANKRADGIIVLGDESMRAVYPFEQVFIINNASYPDDHFDKVTKNYATAKNNFLFFAGSGNVHKGLDLLIDAFQDLEENLYIVTALDKNFLEVFKEELKLPNIHVIGEVNMRTLEFYEAMDACAYAILPSCSEGQAGSVVEAMNQGLIPIVSKETRLDTTGYGYMLKTSSIDEIKATVHQAASQPVAEVARLAKTTREIAKRDHSPAYFEKKLAAHITKILKAAS